MWIPFKSTHIFTERTRKKLIGNMKYEGSALEELLAEINQYEFHLVHMQNREKRLTIATLLWNCKQATIKYSFSSAHVRYCKVPVPN